MAPRARRVCSPHRHRLQNFPSPGPTLTPLTPSPWCAASSVLMAWASQGPQVREVSQHAASCDRPLSLSVTSGPKVRARCRRRLRRVPSSGWAGFVYPSVCPGRSGWAHLRDCESCCCERVQILRILLLEMKRPRLLVPVPDEDRGLGPGVQARASGLAVPVLGAEPFPSSDSEPASKSAPVRGDGAANLTPRGGAPTG